MTVRIIERFYPAEPAPAAPPVPAAHETFLGVPPEGWTAIFTLTLTAATIALILVGVWKIRSLRDKAKKSRKKKGTSNAQAI